MYGCIKYRTIRPLQDLKQGEDNINIIFTFEIIN